MAAKFYTNALAGLDNGSIDLNTDDIRILLVMTNTTADTEDSGISTVGNFTTLDHFDGTSYSTTAGITLAGETVTADTANRRSEFDVTDVAGLAYGDGTREIAGLLYIKFVTDVATSIPIAYDDGTRTVVCAETVAAAATSIPVDPLPYALASGSTIVFGAVTATLSGAAAVGDRSVAVTALSGGIAVDTEGSASVTATASFPVAGSAFTGITFSAEGLFHSQNIVR